MIPLTIASERASPALATNWSDEAKRALLVRYLGFPYWDMLVYPIQALTNVGERDHVEVYRISPREAKWPQPPSTRLEISSGSFFPPIGQIIIALSQKTGPANGQIRPRCHR